MNHPIHFLAASLLVAALVMPVFGGGIASAAAPPNIAAAGATWHATLTQPAPYGTSFYVMSVTKSSSGALSGSVRETDKTCSGSVSGQLSGKNVTMTWTFPASCGGDLFHLTGTVSSNGQSASGTLTSPGEPNGTWTATKG